MTRRTFLGAAVAAVAAIPEKTVVLTMDDAVKSHRTFAGPLLKDLGFRATFFATHQWMQDSEHFMSWAEIAELDRMGFEIGNHSWTHPNFASPYHAARLPAELGLVEYELKQAGVPQPVSFAYSGNSFGPEAVQALAERGYRFARRGEMPEAAYGSLQIGPTFDPRRHHRLLIPTTGDAYPNWTLEHFIEVVGRARRGEAVVLQFHGVPDTQHPWVHTPPENFRRYLSYLKEHGFRVIALRDLEEFTAGLPDPADPLLHQRVPAPKDGRLKLPPEAAATRADLSYWVENMRAGHGYSVAEAARVCLWSEAELRRQAGRLDFPRPAPGVRVRPYPGGRHPRIGFLDGAVCPMRGTKASVSLPWDGGSYIVIDLPEAIFSNLGLLYLAHTHLPTYWDERNVIIDNVDWQRRADGSLESRWTLPNGVGFGASVEALEGAVAMELWLRNGTPEPLSKLRTQICVLLKGAPEFAAQTTANKRFETTVASVQSADGRRWIATSWERCGRTWGNAAVPCLHSDPVLPDCAPGETVRVRGRLWFSEGRAPA